MTCGFTCATVLTLALTSTRTEGHPSDSLTSNEKLSAHLYFGLNFYHDTSAYLLVVEIYERPGSKNDLDPNACPFKPKFCSRLDLRLLQRGWILSNSLTCISFLVQVQHHSEVKMGNTPSSPHPKTELYPYLVGLAFATLLGISPDLVS